MTFLLTIKPACLLRGQNCYESHSLTIVTLSDFVFQSQMQFSVDNIIIQEQNSAI